MRGRSSEMRFCSWRATGAARLGEGRRGVQRLWVERDATTQVAGGSRWAETEVTDVFDMGR